MWKFIVRRLLLIIPQLFLVSMIVFMLQELMPGNVLTPLLADPKITPDRIKELEILLGVNDPIFEQYFRWLANVMQGDFGTSFLHKMPVTELIGDRLINTALLGLLTVVFTYILAIPMGIIGGRYTNSLADRFIVTYNFVGFATPIFIFGIFMLYLFGYTLEWFPTSGSVDPQVEVGTLAFYFSKFTHLLLPALSQALIATVAIVSYLRNEMIDAKVKDYVRTARAKGVTENNIYNKHILRNSLIPIASFIGYEIAGIIGGAVIIENIFSYPGIGRLFLESIISRDYPVVTSLIMLTSLVTFIGTLISDIALSLVDPRVRIK